MGPGLALQRAAADRLPEGLMLVLHPKHLKSLPSALRLESPSGRTTIAIEWRQVRVWELAAADLLATGNPHLAPLAILARHEGEPGTLIAACEKLLESAASEEQDDLRAVTAVLGTLCHPKALLARLLRSRTMLDIPILVEAEQRGIVIGESRGEIRGEARGEARALRNATLRTLRRRLGEVPPEVRAELTAIERPESLENLLDAAAECADWPAFAAALRNAAAG